MELDDEYITYTGALEIADLIESNPIQDDRFETYVQKVREDEPCSECMGSGAEDYYMIGDRRMVIPCHFCKGTGVKRERHFINGIRIKYF